MEISAKKNKRVENDAVRFGVKVTIEFGFDFKIICRVLFKISFLKTSLPSAF